MTNKRQLYNEMFLNRRKYQKQYFLLSVNVILKNKKWVQIAALSPIQIQGVPKWMVNIDIASRLPENKANISSKWPAKKICILNYYTVYLKFVNFLIKMFIGILVKFENYLKSCYCTGRVKMCDMTTLYKKMRLTLYEGNGQQSWV